MEAGKEWCFSVIQVIQVCECPNGWNRKNSENICTFGEIKILFNHFWSLKNFYFNVKFKIVKFKYEALHESYFLVIAWNTMVIFSDVKLELSPLYFLLTSNGSMQVKQTYFFGGGRGGGGWEGKEKTMCLEKLSQYSLMRTTFQQVSSNSWSQLYFPSVTYGVGAVILEMSLGSFYLKLTSYSSSPYFYLWSWVLEALKTIMEYLGISVSDETFVVIPSYILGTANWHEEAVNLCFEEAP